MKRMNEVFELPIKREKSEDGKPVFISMLEQTEKAHAAKHAEALADALAVCVEVLGETPAECIGIERAYHQAIAALAAYRGEK
jgi:hypothetical protein